jgi:hypothetical protein
LSDCSSDGDDAGVGVGDGLGAVVGIGDEIGVGVDVGTAEVSAGLIFDEPHPARTRGDKIKTNSINTANKLLNIRLIKAILFHLGSFYKYRRW